MAQRNVSVRFTAEISNFRRSMEEAAQATQKAADASKAAGKAADKSADEIQKQALAHHEAAKAAGLQYDNTGQLVTMNGKALSSQQAAAHGLQTFSQEAYLAGRAAVTAGEEAEAAAQVAAEAAQAAAGAESEHAAALEEVAIAAALSGAAVVAGVGVAINAYTDFDKQMSSVDAATHETAENMALLRQAAIDAGADTAFSAAEAARGIEELAKAGVATRDILGGGLKGSLDLAAAGSLDVGEAAEIAASALTQFKLSGDKVPHVADLLAAGAGKAQGSVHDLGEALNQSGLVAAQLGLTIEETTGGLAAFASAGLTGSDAGTSFKTMLAAVTPNSKEAAKAMEELGLSAFDSQGKFIGLSEYAGVLQDSLSGMTDEQRIATMETIFGSDAIRAASVLYEQGSAGVEKWESAVNDAGYAADTAARMQNNLAGDLEKLGGSFDSALIKSGSGANDVLRGLVQGLEGLVDVVGSIPGPTLSVGLGMAGVAGGALVLGSGLVALNTKIAATRAALLLVAPAGTRAGTALAMAGTAAKLGGVAAGLGIVTFAVAKLAEADYMSKIDTGMGKVSDALAEISTSGPGAATALDGLFKDRDGGDLISTVTGLESALKRTFNRDGGQQFNDWGEAVVNGMTGVKGSSQILEDSFKRLDTGLAELVSGGKAEDAAKSFEQIKAKATELGVPVEELVKKFPEYADALKAAEAASKTAAAEGKNLDGSLTDAGNAAEAAAKQSEEIEKALEEIGVAADGTVTDLVKFTDALISAGLLQLSARDAARGFEEALDAMDESLKTNGATLDTTTEKGRANEAALDAIAGAGFRSTQAMAANNEGQAALQGSLRGTYDGLLAAAKQFTATDEEAIALTRDILKVPPGVSIDSWMDDEAKRMAESTKGAVNDIPASKVVTIFGNIDPSFRLAAEEAYRLGQIKSAPGANVNVSSGGVQDMGLATGGRIPGYADGGQLPITGPGTGVTDGFLGISSAGVPLARVDAGEWIIKRDSSNRYNRELAAINAGTFPKMPGYADGGRAREFSAQQLGYTSSVSAGAISVASGPVTVYIGDEAIHPRLVRVVRSELDQTSTMAGGRR